MKRIKLTILLLIFAGVVIVAVQIYFTNQTNATSHTVPEIQIEPVDPVSVSAPEVMDTAEQIQEEIYWDELEMLAICVEAEAGNQNIEGKRLVAAVILNRVEDPDFPNTITGVIEQKYHFSSFWNGAMDKIWEPSQETYAAVLAEEENRSNTEVLYFTAGNYGDYGTPWKKVGDHFFSTK